MSELSTTCPKCQGTMVQGFLADFSMPLIMVGSWVAGHPKKNFMPGVNIPSMERCTPVATFRCEQCGFLESYARKEFAAK